MTVIQFNPNGVKPVQSYQKTQQTKYQIQPIDDTFEKLEAAFDAQIAAERAKVPKPQTSEKELINRAWTLYDKALKTKDRVQGMIYEAEANDFVGVKNKKGVPVEFYSDNLGRAVMIEKDEEGVEKRRTTFTPYSNKIWSITTPKTQCIFFDHGKDYTEISKTTKNGLFKYSKEVFSYENGRPVSYSKYKQSLFSDEVLTEACEF
ncbi:MAG: hypothetical protein IJY61_04100 [Candidatus Gastranaerophilales bacterium]|nr:hypothetical protein [Candidatus Gastranaerophilales bacterium]